MPVDRRRLAVAMAGACAFANLYATQPLLPLLGREFGASPAEAGLTVTVGTLSVALVAPVAGLLADGWGRKRVIVAAILAVIVPTLLAGLAGGLTELIVWRGLQGICLPFIFAVTVAYVGEEWAPPESSAVTGFYIAGTIFGGFMGRFVSGVVADLGGWRAAFAVLAALDLLMALAVMRWLPRETRFVRSAGFAGTLRAMAGHLGDRRLASAFAVGFCILFVLVALFTYVGFLLAAPPYGLSTTALGAVFVVYLAGVAASPVAGRLVGRLGLRRVMAIGVAMAVVGVLVTLVPTVPAIVAGLAVATGGIFICQSLATGYVATTAATARSAAVGLYASAYYFGGSLGAVAPALAWSSAGWPGVVALAVGVEVLILAIVLAFWRTPARA